METITQHLVSLLDNYKRIRIQRHDQLLQLRQLTPLYRSQHDLRFYAAIRTFTMQKCNAALELTADPHPTPRVSPSRE